MGAVVYTYYKNAFVGRCEKDIFKAYEFDSRQAKGANAYFFDYIKTECICQDLQAFLFAGKRENTPGSKEKAPLSRSNRNILIL